MFKLALANASRHVLLRSKVLECLIRIMLCYEMNKLTLTNSVTDTHTHTHGQLYRIPPAATPRGIIRTREIGGAKKEKRKPRRVSFFLCFSNSSRTFFLLTCDKKNRKKVGPAKEATHAQSALPHPSCSYPSRHNYMYYRFIIMHRFDSANLMTVGPTHASQLNESPSNTHRSKADHASNTSTAHRCT